MPSHLICSAEGKTTLGARGGMERVCQHILKAAFSQICNFNNPDAVLGSI